MKEGQTAVGHHSPFPPSGILLPFVIRWPLPRSLLDSQLWGSLEYDQLKAVLRFDRSYSVEESLLRFCSAVLLIVVSV